MNYNKNNKNELNGFEKIEGQKKSEHFARLSSLS